MMMMMMVKMAAGNLLPATHSYFSNPLCHGHKSRHKKTSLWFVFLFYTQHKHSDKIKFKTQLKILSGFSVLSAPLESAAIHWMTKQNHTIAFLSTRWIDCCWMGGWLFGWMDGWVVGCLDDGMIGWMDGWIAVIGWSSLLWSVQISLILKWQMLVVTSVRWTII